MLDYDAALEAARLRIHWSIDTYVDSAMAGAPLPAWPQKREHRLRTRTAVRSNSDFDKYMEHGFRALKSIESRNKTNTERIDSASISLMRLIGVLCLPDQQDGELSLSLPSIMAFGLPSIAFAAIVPSEEEGDDWFPVIRMQSLTTLPSGVFPAGPGYAFELQSIWTAPAGKNGAPFGAKWYVTISHDGTVHPCMQMAHSNRKIHHRRRGGWSTVTRPEFKQYNFVTDRLSVIEGVALIVSAWQQMHIDPIVEIDDEDGRRLLFPMSYSEISARFPRRVTGAGTGMHWVAAHTRRAGAHVRTHLRGANQFSYGHGHRHVTIRVPGDRSAVVKQDLSHRIRPMILGNEFVGHSEQSITPSRALARLTGAKLVSAGVYENELYGPIPSRPPTLHGPFPERAYYKGCRDGGYEARARGARL